jgi:hypothetical protein
MTPKTPKTTALELTKDNSPLMKGCVESLLKMSFEKGMHGDRVRWRLIDLQILSQSRDPISGKWQLTPFGREVRDEVIDIQKARHV